MPLPSSDQIVQTGHTLVDQLQAISGGKHPGFRPAHAKGILLTGTFIPTREAAQLSSAPHFTTASGTPVIARFSNSTGLPQVPDTDPATDPRGLAVRFNLGTDNSGRRSHTDIICHSTPLFPVRTGEDFSAFFQAVLDSSSGITPSPTPIEQFLGSHPAARTFVQTPKPAPSSFARAHFWGVTAYQLVSAAGEVTHVRFQLRPEAGVEHASTGKGGERGSEYLFDQLRDAADRLRREPIAFRLVAQIAGPDDVVDDATVLWPGADAEPEPDDREGKSKSGGILTLGMVKLDGLVPAEEQAQLQKQIIFDPVPRVEGVRPSKDPLLEMRSAVYLISGRERREA